MLYMYTRMCMCIYNELASYAGDPDPQEFREEGVPPICPPRLTGSPSGEGDVLSPRGGEELHPLVRRVVLSYLWFVCLFEGGKKGGRRGGGGGVLEETFLFELKMDDGYISR